MTNENRLGPDVEKKDGSQRPPTIAEVFANIINVPNPLSGSRRRPKATDLSPVIPKKQELKESPPSQ